MPRPFNSAVMTDAGARLLTRAQAGEIKIEFTRIAIGNGNYAEEEKTLDFLQCMTGLRSLKNSYPLSDISIFSDYSVKVTALITNQDPVTKETLITQGYYINEMGLYAKPSGADDSEEIIYSIVITSGENGDFMPPYNGYSPAQITQEYFATVNNSAEVTINYTGAVATAEQIQDLQSQIDKINTILARFTKYSYNSSTGRITNMLPFDYAGGKLTVPDGMGHFDGNKLVLTNLT